MLVIYGTKFIADSSARAMLDTEKGAVGKRGANSQMAPSENSPESGSEQGAALGSEELVTQEPAYPPPPVLTYSSARPPSEMLPTIEIRRVEVAQEDLPTPEEVWSAIAEAISQPEA